MQTINRQVWRVQQPQLQPQHHLQPQPLPTQNNQHSISKQQIKEALYEMSKGNKPEMQKYQAYLQPHPRVTTHPLVRGQPGNVQWSNQQPNIPTNVSSQEPLLQQYNQYKALTSGASFNPVKLGFVPPYQIPTELSFDYIGVTTYRQMLDNPSYDRQIKTMILSEDLTPFIKDEKSRQKYGHLVGLLDQPIYLFSADLQPENIQWTVFKHHTQMDRFINQMEPEMHKMEKSQKRQGDTGLTIIGLYKQLNKAYHSKYDIKEHGIRRIISKLHQGKQLLDDIKHDIKNKYKSKFSRQDDQNFQQPPIQQSEQTMGHFNKYSNDQLQKNTRYAPFSSDSNHAANLNNQNVPKKLQKRKAQNWQQTSRPPMIAEFIKLCGRHPYLKKSVIVLTFIHHCMPIHLWNIKVYQQVPIYYDPTIFTRLWENENQIEQYLTVTGDGIMISTKNPIETKIEQMVPFTNQFKFNSEIQDDGDLYFTISSCLHQNIKVNFKKDFVGGLNFHIGTKRAIIDSRNHVANRYNSFSGTRKNCYVKLYNDGQDYFSDVFDQMKAAKKQVLITDWWLTPYINLKRPKDKLTKYQVSHMSLKEQKKYFQRFMLGTVLNQIADRGVKVYIIIFREPLNLLSTDSYDCQLFLQSLSPNIRVRRHPITPQLWSHHEKCVIIDQKVGFMGGLDLCYGRWDNHQHSLTNKYNQWDGGDYVNQRLRSYLPGSTKKRQTPIDMQKQPRMPWHDIAIQIKGDAVIDLTRHFVQYWYFVDNQRVKDPYNHFRNLQRRIDRAINYNNPDQINEKKGCCGCGNFDQFKTSANLFLTGTETKHRQLLVQARAGRVRGEVQLQLCRSASPWSIGARNFQQSIHYAYQALIAQSQHLIYIQNQFFMGNNNKIVDKLAERIELAHRRQENFKIVVVMPLLPGFEGDIQNKKNRPLRVQVQNQFQSINRGQHSLWGILKGKKLQNFNINDYIFFFGLRTHAVIDNKPVTEIIYVHSKLMIVDDKRAIIGSANINDRSLCGNRDSELAIVIEQNNGNIKDLVARRKDIFKLRARIFNEHFGLTQEEAANSNDPYIWASMINHAKSNTLIYRKLFGCYPDDTITVSSQVEQLKNKAETNLDSYYRNIGKIKAHAVQFPLNFLQDEDLSLQFSDKQKFLLGIDAFL